MQISSATSGLAAAAVASTTSAATAPATGTGTAGSAHSVAMSGKGQLMAALQQLKQARPDQFQAVVSQLAQEVKDAAASATGPEKHFLDRLGRQLDRVARTGDLRALQGHHHHEEGGHHARGVEAYQAQAQASGETARAHHHHHHRAAGGEGDEGSAASAGAVGATPPAEPPAEPPAASTPTAGATPPVATGTGAVAPQDPRQRVAALLADLLEKVKAALAEPAAGGTPEPASPPADPLAALTAVFADLLQKVHDALVAPTPAPAPAATQAAPAAVSTSA